MKYRREIDGLRTLAVIPVILFHAGFQIFSGGFVGVDVFFVISGYLITTIILAELELGKFSIINFYERRARRILPALFLVMLVCLPLAWALLWPRDMKSFSQSLIAVSVFSSNILFWQTGGYFDTAAELKPLLHTWSLAVEEQYYVFFPIFLMATWKLGKRWILGLLAFTFVASLILAQWSSIAKPIPAFFLLPMRGWELLIGTFVAFYLANYSTSSMNNRLKQLGAFAGLALIIFAIFRFNKDMPVPSLYTLVPTLGAALIILCATQETIAGRFLGNKLFVGIGLISYSAYLWHQPLFVFARYISIDEPSPPIMLLLSFFSIVLAYLSWRFVETPVRYKHRFNRNQIFSFSAIGMVVFITAGLFGYSNKGLDNRLPAESRDSAIFGSSNELAALRHSDGSCVRLLGLPALSEEVCLSVSKSPKILFAGDSHAMALYSSIYGKLIESDALLVSANTCPLFDNLNYSTTFKYNFDRHCKEISNEILRVAKKIESIDTVFLINLFSNVDDVPSRAWFDGKNLSNRQAFVTGYDSVVSNLIMQGKRVIFVVDVPKLKYNPRVCLQKMSIALGDAKECRSSTVENQIARKDYIDEVYKLKNRHPELIIYDPTNFFCKRDFCEMAVENKSLYDDTNHLSVYGSLDLLRNMQHEGLLNH